MAYRQLEHHHHHDNRTAQKLVTPAEFFMTNGSTFDLAFPCFYKEIHKPIRARHHCRAWHDHVGNPDPMHPDDVCQDYDFAALHCHGDPCYHGEYDIPWMGHSDHPYDHPHGAPLHPDHPHRHAFNRIDMAKLVPIHLLQEGYERCEVAFLPSLPGLSAKAWIDEADDWIIRVKFSAWVEDDDFKPQSTRFAVRVYNDGEERCDVASIAEIVVMPAARW